MAGDNIRQTDKIVEEHETMINNMQSLEIAQTIVWKGFIGVLWSSIRYGLPSYVITIEDSNIIISESFRPFVQFNGSS